jgi:hypothetical protein
MGEALESLLKDTFSDLDDLSSEKVRDLINEALKTFNGLQESAADPTKKEEILKTINSLKDTIQNQIEELSEKTGIDSAELMGMGENLQETDSELWSDLQEAKEEFAKFT